MEELNCVYWDRMKDVPVGAQTAITGGRLKGKTDIKPQWRLQIMTEVFGPIGIGWNYKTIERWIEDHSGEVSAHVVIQLVYKVPETNEWSLPVEGQGGSMLLAKEKTGNFHSDEAYKMATTDALSVAMKQIGVAANIYLGQKAGSGSKYTQDRSNAQPKKMASQQQLDELTAISVELETITDPNSIKFRNNCTLAIKEGVTYANAAEMIRSYRNA